MRGNPPVLEPGREPDKREFALEAVREMIEALKVTTDVDQRAVAIARTHFETAFLWVSNALVGGWVP